MAETVVSTILEQLTTIAIENAREEWALVTGVEEEVERLASNFKAIQLELEDAEEKQFMNGRVKHWLDRFKQVSYDMEDVLEDWKTALDQLQPDGDETSSVPKWMVCLFLSYFSFCSRVVRRHDIATRIKEINEKLKEIAKDGVRTQLIRSEIKQPKRLESTSFIVDVSRIVGRDVVKEKIISRLLSGTAGEGSSNHVPTITVVGMGGMGKTALAQAIYNDPEVQAHFEHKIWVCVSDPFDQNVIARKILGGLDPDSKILGIHPVSLDRLLYEIRVKIATKKVFLVLDDVWADRDEDWEPLKATFQYSKMGSWILATSRKESVARQMGWSDVFHLQELSEEMCWLIIAQLAFIGGDDKNRKHLEVIGRKIAEKCKGLPLAAKTLGCLLRDKPRREEWENVLHSEMWKIKFEEVIFSSLVLSYNDLPSIIRRCLLYCAIFPKGYQIDKDELIRHWMTQDYLNFDDDFERELQGEDYFKCLAARSFFQDFEKDGDGNIRSCTMHDMVHDFIQFLTKYEVVVEEVKVKDLTLDLSSREARHLRLAIARESTFPLSINGGKKLRSLVAATPGFCDTSNEKLQNLFITQSKRLRLLELVSLFPGAQEICREIGSLFHLRYLRLAFCHDISSLPEAVCELHNLQSLIIEGCFNLKELPVGMGNLINLRYLVIGRCPFLTFYPKGVGKLTSLRRLSGISMRADGNDAQEMSIGDLQYLDHLTDLKLGLLGQAVDGEEAKRAKLHNKIHLKRIQIDICSPDITKEEVVQVLNPPSNSSVVIVSYLEKILYITNKAALRFLEAAGKKN